MKIVVNTRLLLKNRLEGIGWFTFETLKRITNNHPDVDFVFVFDRDYDESFVFSPNVTPVVLFPPTRHPFLWYIWFEWQLKNLLKKEKPDLFFSPDGYLCLSTSVPSVAVIHDINFAHYPLTLPFWARKYYNYYFPRFAKKSNRLATVSEYSKSDIVKTYQINPEKIDVVYNGANTMYKPLTENEKEATRIEFFGDAKQLYFVYVGALLPRKNVARMLLAYNDFRKKSSVSVKMLIVGGIMFKTSDITEVYEKMEYKSDVVFAGRQSPEKLKYIIGSAFALTYVPWFEGFGIPILEAMYCHVPVITSNVTSMPEVAGDAAILVDPYSVDSICNAMLEMTNNDNLRNELIERTQVQKQLFSWDKTAENVWNSLMKALKSN